MRPDAPPSPEASSETPLSGPAAHPDSTDTRARWQRVRALLEAALEQPPLQREGFVRAAGLSAAEQDEVLSLLAHATGGAEAADDFLAAPAAQAWLLDDASTTAASGGPSTGIAAGTRLGAWRLEKRLGVGGMGEVWLAQRDDGSYAGDAAVKLLKRGMDSEAVLQRFALERQALARLDHPHIARLFDAGVGPQGHPYFVMERVQGLPIDRAVQGRPLEERLALFLQLTDAVSHAHRNLLVHRDLKPGNVMVNAAGQVKLLDFGIAKALDPSNDPEAGAQTLAGPRPYTPTHASPEQVRGEAVSTATDVYSLGVLLYQLLTGRRPYAQTATHPAELARAVLTETPRTPSSWEAPPDEDREAARTWLHTRQRLAGDLDHILLKALEKDPAARYASVEAFAQDLRAYLAGAPVSARAPGRAYLVSKFVRRHRLPVALAASTVLALSVGLLATAWQARQAALARDAAQLQLAAVKGIVTELVFRFGDSLTYLPGGASAQDALLADTQKALEPLLVRLPDDATVWALQAGVLSKRAEILLNATTGTPEQVQQGRRYLEDSLKAAERAGAAPLREWRYTQAHVRALQLQADLARNAGQPADSLRWLETAAQRLEAALPQVPSSELYGRNALEVELANLLIAQGQALSASDPEATLQRYQRAEPYFRALVADRKLQAALDAKAVPGEMRSGHYLQHQLGTLLASRALTLYRLERLEPARQNLVEALELRRRNVADDPKNLAFREGLLQEANVLAVVQTRLGDAASALPTAQLAWDTCAALAQEQGPKSKWATLPRVLAVSLGRAHLLQGHAREALALADRGLALWKSHPPAQPSALTAWRQGQLQLLRAEALQQLGQGAAAQEAARRSLQSLAALSELEPVKRDILLLQAQLRLVLIDAGAADAPALARIALQQLDAAAALRALAPDHEALRVRLSRKG